MNYDPFPNPHIRTNAFMMSREMMSSVKHGLFMTKSSVHRFESGKSGLTKQIVQRGLKALVVGKDGKEYDIDEWPVSRTFWQDDQSNLLVADNQTRRYARSDERGKRMLTSSAWGSAVNSVSTTRR